eukprot:scaffold24451_cov18-Tisochrysis_lutea.AAC.2
MDKTSASRNVAGTLPQPQPGSIEGPTNSFDIVVSLLDHSKGKRRLHRGKDASFVLASHKAPLSCNLRRTWVKNDCTHAHADHKKWPRFMCPGNPQTKKSKHVKNRLAP